MKWKIHAVGKPSLAYAKLGVEDYLARLRHYTSCELAFAKEGGLDELALRSEKDQPTWPRIILDERGRQQSSEELAKQIDAWQQSGIGGAFCFVGGANGHSSALRERASFVLSLSRLTLQHELALLVFLEQLYRAHTILRGEPYHR